MFKKTIIGMLVITLLFTNVFAAGNLIINSDTSNPAPKMGFEALVRDFEKAYPDIKVKTNVQDRESYKVALRNWLVTSPPDIVFWYAGNRMKQFVNKGLLADVSDVWNKENLSSSMASTKASLTIDGKQWGVPYTYYNWGIYYRKDIFDKYGIAVPKTWDEFLAASAKLKKNDITPITIGTKFLWTAAGWFDYLNLRVNGYEFHIDLMDGNVSYTDARVKEVFKYWDQLVKPGYFLKDHASYSWQDAQPFLYRGQAAMYLIGNFITPHFPDDVKDKMDYFQFPIIKKGIAIAEDAPTDTIHIPSRAKNIENAKKFLAFAAEANSQTKFNKTLLQLPANKNAQVADDRFLAKGQAVLATAKTAQFYDRDTDPEMAKEGMKGFQEYMVKPDRINAILKRLETKRKRVFKK